MTRSERLAWLTLAWLVPGLAAAQGGPLPEGHPPSDAGSAHGGIGARMQQVLRPPPPVPAHESSEVPEGAIRVLVVDERGQPVPDHPVNVGSLASGTRARVNGRTGQDGIVWFRDLAVGSSQHYRVNIPHQGATYSTMPFALPANGSGYEVRAVRLPVTQSDELVFLHLFRTVVQQRGERMHVIHQAQLTNAGDETYVFPSDEVRGALPEDALSFQFQRVMTDQRVEELEEEGAYVLRGSLPPGTVQLAYAYDIPLEGGALEIPVDIPLRFFGMQVIVEALPELDVRVSGMENPRRLDTNGEACQDSTTSEGCAWVVQARRSPTDPPLDRIVIRISGIPGPGPTRTVAVIVVAFFAVAGVLLLLTARHRGTDLEARDARRAAILEEAELLAEDLKTGEAGPVYAGRRRDELVRELAALYYADEVSSGRHADVAERETRRRRPGPAGYLLPAEDATATARSVEYLLTVLASPLLLLGTLFVWVRPYALSSYRGQGEVAITLVLGALGALLLYVGGDLLGLDPGVIWPGVAASALALALRTIVRQAPPEPSGRRTA